MKSIRESLRGKNILLTGSTGFLGKVFLERVLRSSSEVGRVFILVRSIDAHHSVQRLETDIFSSRLFDQLKEQLGHSFTEFVRDKITFVGGDTSLPSLGMTPRDYIELLSNIDFVVNSAASTDFMDRLDTAIETNSFSVKNVVEFVKLSSKARLLHISTCYVSESEVELVQEKPKLQPTHARKSFAWKDSESLDIEGTLKHFDKLITQTKSKAPAREKQHAKLIELGYRTAQKHGWYNVYTMTKWLGERILVQASGDIHATIVRPSIIEGSLFEPIAGWIEGLKVADPIFYAFGTRMFNQFPGDKDSVLDLVPVDMVSNAMMLSLAELASQDKPELKVYQSCSGGENPLTLGELVPLLATAFGRKHVPGRVYYPSRVFFSVFKPIDYAQRSLLWLGRTLGVKPVIKKMEKAQRNMKRYMLLATLYAPYVSIRCRYDNTKLQELHARAASEDRLAYPVSASLISWEKYICHIHVPGLMRFVIKPQMPTAVVQPEPAKVKAAL